MAETAAVAYWYRPGGLPDQASPDQYLPLLAELSRRLTPGAVEDGTADVADTVQLISCALAVAAELSVCLRNNELPGLVPALGEVERVLRTGPPVWIGEPFLRVDLVQIRAERLSCKLSLCVDLRDTAAERALDNEPLVVEDGSGVPGANSYQSVEGADRQWRGRAGGADWLALPRIEKERALKRSTRALGEFLWYGLPAKPVIRSTNGEFRIRELLLSFTRGARTLDVGLRWATEVRSPRKVLNRVASYADVAKVFYPPPESSVRAVRTSVDDMHALALCHLIQGRFVDLAEDEAAADYLRCYLRSFRYASEASNLAALGDIWRNFTAAQDYRGFRQYVGATLRGLHAQSFDRATLSHPPDSVHSVAQRLGCTPQALYHRIRHGKVRTEHRDGRLLIPDDEQARLEAEMGPRRRRCEAVQRFADEHGLKKDSVRKRLRRAQRKAAART